MTAKVNNNTFKIQPTWNDVYRNNNVFDLPWVDLNIKSELKNVIDSLPNKTGKALDIGCGLGQVSRYLAEVGFEVTAIDISEEAISWAKKLNKTRKNIKFIIANSITFESDNIFDLIVDFLHIHDIEINYIKKYLCRLDSLLSAGGTFIFSTFLNNLENKDEPYSRRSYFVNQEIFYYSLENVLSLLPSKYLLKEKILLTAGNESLSIPSYLVLLKKQ